MTCAMGLSPFEIVSAVRASDSAPVVSLRFPHVPLPDGRVVYLAVDVTPDDARTMAGQLALAADRSEALRGALGPGGAA